MLLFSLFFLNGAELFCASFPALIGRIVWSSVVRSRWLSLRVDWPVRLRGILTCVLSQRDGFYSRPSRENRRPCFILQQLRTVAIHISNHFYSVESPLCISMKSARLSLRARSYQYSITLVRVMQEMVSTCFLNIVRLFNAWKIGDRDPRAFKCIFVLFPGARTCEVVWRTWKISCRSATRPGTQRSASSTKPAVLLRS